jgi:4'-phosphopantetheinyl transferase
MSWQELQDIPVLKSGQVHVWHVNQDVSSSVESKLFDYLSEDEKTRAKRFYRASDQMHFTVARAMLRICLGQYLSLKPAEIVFSYTQYGKPYVVDSDLKFNISHAYGQALLAFGWDMALGIDLEMMQRTVEWESLSKRFFSQHEAQAIRAFANETQQKQAFFRCWTRKEAYVKARGDGLSRSLEKFEVSVTEKASLIIDRADGDATKDWQMQAIELPDELPYQAALVCQSLVLPEIVLFSSEASDWL